MKEWVIKTLLLNIVIKRLELWLAKLPVNNAKTITGLIVAVLGVTVAELPDTSDYIQPVLDALKHLPSDIIIDSGVVWAVIGLFHKALKWIIKKTKS
jgi:hypothetical protein